MSTTPRRAAIDTTARRRSRPSSRPNAAHRGRAAPLRSAPTAAVLLCCLLAATLPQGCGERDRHLGLDDLMPAERRYVERVVVLERAKAVALVDPEAGTALLDSLAEAWGDSAMADTRALAPREPRRSAAVASLLLRVLQAEEDSLVQAPRPDRLARPLPDPVPPEDADQ